MVIPRYATPLIVALACLLLAGCSQDAPAKTAEQFIVAMAANDMATLEEIVDPAVVDDVLMGVIFQAGLQAFVGGGSVEVVDLETKTISKNGNHATVSVQGDFKTNALGTSLITPVDMQMELVKIDGSWYVTE